MTEPTDKIMSEIESDPTGGRYDIAAKLIVD